MKVLYSYTTSRRESVQACHYSLFLRADSIILADFSQLKRHLKFDFWPKRLKMVKKEETFRQEIIHFIPKVTESEKITIKGHKSAEFLEEI